MTLRRFITSRPWLTRLAKRVMRGPIRAKVVLLIKPERYRKMTGPLGQDMHLFGFGYKAIAIWRRKPWED